MNGMNEMIGTKLNDKLLGTLSADRILGLDGDDTIEGSSGRDTLNGGNGNDSISGNTFPLVAPRPIDPIQPIINGSAIEDLILRPFDIGDSILGGQGNDTIAGSLGNDTIRSGSGNDLVYGGDPPQILGIKPDPVITRSVSDDGPTLPTPIPFPLDDGNDRIFAGSGDDTVYGGSGADTVRGGSGNDLIIGNGPGLTFPIRPIKNQPDQILRPPQIDDLGDDLRGGAGNDKISGASGADTVLGGGGDDFVNGGIGNDLLNGNTGSDKIDGGAGNDTVNGGGGDDKLIGGFGNDKVRGGRGNDILTGASSASANPGQLERDTFMGGAGGDRFILGDAKRVYYDDSQVRFVQASPADQPPPSYGLITDFQLGQDVIQLNGSEKYELREVKLSEAAFGLGIYFDADRQGDNGPEQLIGIIQSDDDLTKLTMRPGEGITELR